jgi:hypothetical protein
VQLLTTTARHTSNLTNYTRKTLLMHYHCFWYCSAACARLQQHCCYCLHYYYYYLHYNHCCYCCVFSMTLSCSQPSHITPAALTAIAAAAVLLMLLLLLLKLVAVRTVQCVHACSHTAVYSTSSNKSTALCCIAAQQACLLRLQSSVKQTVSFWRHC